MQTFLEYLESKQPLTVDYVKGMKVLSLQKVVAYIDKNSNGRLDLRAIRKQLDSKFFTVVDVDINRLIGYKDSDVDASRATPSKGPIVVNKDGYIVDGRHRTKYAKEHGKSRVSAYVPVTPPRR